MEEKKVLRTVSDVLQIVDIALDSYDDIFSDFDPSPFTTRILSEDFLRELYRRYPQAGKGQYVVNLTMPASLRQEKTEHLIRKRIKDHFRDRIRILELRTREKLHSGLIRCLFGFAISIAFFVFPSLESAPLLTILSVLIWYSLWSGFELILESSLRLSRKKGVVEKLMKADYNFMDQEEVVQTIQKLQIRSVG
ncbi:MAG: hypothetical protein U0R44_03620 [Candidatus Micrarchaeia archaeon]